MPKREHTHSRFPRVFALPVLSLVLLGLLAGCSLSLGGGGSSNISLGLAGSTSDHPAQPPTVNGGPNGTVAFVYDNQIWLSKAGQSGATQLTHLVLSNGANIAWGPLVWSQSGRYIAFALVQNLTPTTPGGTSGPIFYVDTRTGPTYGQVNDTGATGSTYGHSYAWFGDSMLFYATGGGILMFGPVNIPNADPRSWQVIDETHNVSGNGETYVSGNATFSDIAIGANNGDLFYSQVTLTSPGSSGAVGSAAVFQANLPSLDAFNAAVSYDQNNNTNTVPGWIQQSFPLPSVGAQVADLGAAYLDASGDIVTGAWNISPDEHVLVAQRISGVDTKHNTVSSSICRSNALTYGGYGYCAPILGDAGKAPLSAHLELSISPGDGRVAYTNGTLYIANTNGNAESKLASAGWTTPPEWTPDNKTVTATQLASSSTDANGVIHNTTNILLFSGGSSGATFVAGGQDPSWWYGS